MKDRNSGVLREGSFVILTSGLVQVTDTNFLTNKVLSFLPETRK